MTVKEFYEAIVAGNLTEEVVERASTELEKINTKAAEKAAENSVVIEEIIALLDKEVPVERRTLIELTGRTGPFISARMKEAEEAGLVKAVYVSEGAKNYRAFLAL